jgi:hypothetical protein
MNLFSHQHLILLAITVALVASVWPVPSTVLAQDGGQNGIPEPHLGYGLHLDPNVPVDPSVVNSLGMD